MLEEFRQEISIMKRLRHPHIVQFVSRRLRAAGAAAPPWARRRPYDASASAGA